MQKYCTGILKVVKYYLNRLTGKRDFDFPMSCMNVFMYRSDRGHCLALSPRLSSQCSGQSLECLHTESHIHWERTR